MDNIKVLWENYCIFNNKFAPITLYIQHCAPNTMAMKVLNEAQRFIVYFSLVFIMILAVTIFFLYERVLIVEELVIENQKLTMQVQNMTIDNQGLVMENQGLIIKYNNILNNNTSEILEQHLEEEKLRGE